MKIVIDTNIIVSASIWRGKPGSILDRVIKNLDTLFITDEIAREIDDTFKKEKFDKFRVTQDKIDAIVKLGQRITVLPQHKATGTCRDPKDDMYLECALAANADYIVSGDKHLRELKMFKGIKIVNASEYLEIVDAV